MPRHGIGLTGTLVLGAAAALGAAQAPAGDGRAGTVVGTVERNQRDCHRDGPCQLHLLSGATRWLVVYHPGEGEHPGVRADLVHLGQGIERGSVVSASGRVTATGTVNVLLLLGDQADLRIVKRP